MAIWPRSFGIYEIDAARVNADLTRVMDKFKTGNSRPPGLSTDMVKLAREAWALASLQYGESILRSGHLLTALLADESLGPIAREMSAQFVKINAEALRKDLLKIVADTAETAASAQASAAQAATAGGAPRKGGGPTPALDQYTVDLSRTREIREDRSRARPRCGNPPDHRYPDAAPAEQSDPHRRSGRRQDRCRGRFRAAHRPPMTCRPDLRGVSLRSLDLGLLQAGAGMKGEFENRLKSVIDEVKSLDQADHHVHR